MSKGTVGAYCAVVPGSSLVLIKLDVQKKAMLEFASRKYLAMRGCCPASATAR